MRSSLTHQEHKKSADPHQAAESSVEIFRSGDFALPHIDPYGSRHLAVSNGRLPDSVFRITPHANIILRELSRNLHVFFGFAMLKKERKRGTVKFCKIVAQLIPQNAALLHR